MTERQRYALFIDGPADGHRMLIAGHEPPEIEVPNYPGLDLIASLVPDLDALSLNRDYQRSKYLRQRWRSDVGTRPVRDSQYVLYTWSGS